MSIAVVFSGQGSQYVGMTKDLVTQYDVAAALASNAQTVLGRDLLQIMHEGPVELLTETRNTQPALFLHEAMVAEITGVMHNASMAAGHSLGEYSALYAAGVLSFDDALRLVELRGRLMFEAGENLPGTMAAVVGLDDAAVEELCAELNGVDGNVLVPANYNAPGQVVVSGSREYLRSSLDRFKERGAKIVKELQVSGAFHSPLLSEAKAELTEALNSVTFNESSVPIYVNVSAEPLAKPDELRNAAIEQLTSPVRWTQSIQKMSADGANQFIEVGPQKVLQGLIKRISSEATLVGIDTAEQCAQYLKEKS